MRRLLPRSCLYINSSSSASKGSFQSELPRPIPRNFVESDHGCTCTSRIYFDNAGDNVDADVI